MKRIIFLCAVIWAALFVRDAASAPMIPYGPMDVEGTVSEISWQPEQFIKGVKVNMGGKEVPMSGSLGVDRRIKAKYRIILRETVVEKPKGETSPYYRSYPTGSPVDVTVYHDKDDGYMKKGMRIKIYGYTVGGDEGGTWSSYDRIEIVKGE